MTESAMPEALTVEQAVASLVEPPEAQTPDPAPEQAAEPEAQVEDTEAATEAEEPASEAAEPGDGEEEVEAVEPEAPEVEAPAWWKAEHKAKFKELPPELQAVVREQEQTRERLVSEAKERAATAEKQRDEDLKGVRTLAEQLNAFWPEAVQTFQSRWGEKEPDWSEVAEKYGADEAFKLKTRFETEQKQLVTLADANRRAQAEAHKAFVEAEWKVLAERAPELAPDVSDPTKGTEQRQAVIKYLEKESIPKGALANISATEMLIAHKAMLWDQAQARLSAAPKSKPATPAPKTPVRPAAAQAQPSSQRSASTAANRFAQTRSAEDAVAYLIAKG